MTTDDVWKDAIQKAANELAVSLFHNSLWKETEPVIAEIITRHLSPAVASQAAEIARLRGREDDAVPITEEWLLAIGWISGVLPDSGEFYYSWRGIHLVQWEGEWRLQIGGTENFWEYYPGLTRGSIRKFCEALGIQLKEQPHD